MSKAQTHYSVGFAHAAGRICTLVAQVFQPAVSQVFNLRTARKTSAVRQFFGFTLMEVMIAMAILGVIFTAIYSSWSAIVRGSKVGLEAAAQVQRVRMAVRCLVDSLLTVQMFSANGAYYSFIADTSSQFASLSIVSRLPASFPDAGLFGDQVVRRVSFQVEAGPGGTNQLVMYQMPLLNETNAEQQPFPIVLARDVNTFNLEFWGPNTNRWSPDWISTNTLPKLVRITLGFGRNQQPEDQVTRVVSLMAMSIPPAFQMSPGGPIAPPVLPPGVVPPGGNITTGPPWMRSGLGGFGDQVYPPNYTPPGGQPFPIGGR